MKTALAVLPSPDHCATCGTLLPERSPNSPEVRYDQDHWWDEQERLWRAGEPIRPDVRAMLERKHGAA